MRRFTSLICLLSVSLLGISHAQDRRIPPEDLGLASDSLSSLVLIDRSSLGSPNRKVTFRKVNLACGRFYPNIFKAARLARNKLISPSDDSWLFSADRANPQYVAWMGVARDPDTRERLDWRSRVPVFELSQSHAYIISLRAAEVGMDADEAELEAIERAANEALDQYPSVEVDAEIATPIAFIDVTREGSGRRPFSLVEDRRPEEERMQGIEDCFTGRLL